MPVIQAILELSMYMKGSRDSVCRGQGCRVSGFEQGFGSRLISPVSRYGGCRGQGTGRRAVRATGESAPRGRRFCVVFVWGVCRLFRGCQQ